jgi:hypothetical protein
MAMVYRSRPDATLAIPGHFESALRSELSPHEHILWAAVPSPWRIWWSSAAIVPFALFWNGFVVFWIWGAAHASVWFALFGLPFLVVGMTLLYAPVKAYRTARATFYALTTERAILFEGPTVTSYTRAMMTELVRTPRADGSGDLVFAERTRTGARNGTTSRVGFIAVPNVREVERLIREEMLG